MSDFLAAFFRSLPVEYCILHGWQGLPEHLPSDLDIVVAPQDLAKLEEALFKADTVKPVQVFQYAADSYYFVLAVRKADKISFLKVDAISDYRGKGGVWFQGKELLEGRTLWKDFWIAAPEVEFKYLLTKKIIKADFPEHSRVRLRELALMLDGKAETIAEELLGRRWGYEVAGWVRAGEWETLQTHLKTLKRILLLQSLRRDPLNPLRYWLPELRRIWSRWWHSTGLFVSVLGPDGAGKSTLVKRLQEELAGAFRRTAVFHFNPNILRRRVNQGPVTDPHGRPPRHLIMSLLKLIYYWFDFTLGYWFKVRPALARSTLVLFDRYYDDVLVDPRRYRYGGPMWLARLLRWFIPRPNVFLIIEVFQSKILERKQEVEKCELGQLLTGYRDLAAHLCSGIILDGAASVGEVAQQAKDALLHYLHERYQHRRRLWFPERQEHHLLWLGQVLRAEVKRNPGRFTHVFLRLADGRGYLLPLHNSKVFRWGLQLYRAQARKARLVQQILKAISHFSFSLRALPLDKVYLDLSDMGTKESLIDCFQSIFRREDLSIAVSLGTPGPQRKPVVQIISNEGKVLGYAKIGYDETTKALVQNEMSVLKRLQSEDFAFMVPKVIYGGEWRERLLCVQSPPPDLVRPAPQSLGKLYLDALKAISQISRCRKWLAESAFWQHIQKRLYRVSSNYLHQVLTRGIRRLEEKLKDEPIPFHLSHGDFTPWNALEGNRGIFLFDWENSKEEAPAGYDLFHFIVRTRWLVRKESAQEIISAIHDECQHPYTKAYWSRLDVSQQTIDALFLAYLIDVLSSMVVDNAASWSNLKLYSDLIVLESCR